MKIIIIILFNMISINIQKIFILNEQSFRSFKTIIAEYISFIPRLNAYSTIGEVEDLFIYKTKSLKKNTEKNSFAADNKIWSAKTLQLAVN